MKDISLYNEQGSRSNIQDFKLNNSNVGHNNSIPNNPFITSANPVIAFILHIRKSKTPPNLEKIRDSIVNEIKHFENKLSQLGYENKKILAARYCLCTAIDESILRTEWGTQTMWVQNTLLSYFHNETWGGERFYIILEVLSKNPRENIGVLELLYTLLSLGFEGKHYEKNSPIREEIQYKTLQTIKHVSGKQSRQLATHTQNINQIKKIQQKGKSIKWFYCSLAALIITTLIICNIKLANKSKPLFTQMNQIGVTPAETTFSQLINRKVQSNNEDN
jgi:type VI secretion system protein ImpK